MRTTVSRRNSANSPRPFIKGWAAFALALLFQTAAQGSVPKAMDPERPLWLRFPAVSPDGSKVAFCWGGQVWVTPVGGGDALPITSSLFYSKNPVWSPDGSHIGFASDRFGNDDVFIVPAGGGEIRRLTFTSVDDVPVSFSNDGSLVYFTSKRLGDPVATFYIGSLIGLQLHAVPAKGGRERLIIPTPTANGQQEPGGDRILYENISSVEQPWRKHAVSDATRKIWLYDPSGRTHRLLTTSRHENRNPVWGTDGKSFYFLSERSGSSNVWRQSIDGPEDATQITHHTTHPVRSLSISRDGSLVYSYDGELWRLAAGETEPVRIAVRISQSSLLGGEFKVNLNDEATELAVSPSGKEFALVARGEVFVVSATDGSTSRITNTPSRETSVRFRPDGRALLYAAERQGHWGLYETQLVRSTDKTFSEALEFSESVVLDTPADETQGVYSPDSKRVAYLEARDLLRVFDRETGKVVSLSGQYPSYSYEDGDVSFVWSPDGSLIAATSGVASNGEVFLLDPSGERPPLNISRSGASDGKPVFSADSQTLFWATGRHGLRSPLGDAMQQDVYAAFLTEEAYHRWTGASTAPSDPPSAWTPDFKGQSHRSVRLTPFPVTIGDLAPTSSPNQIAMLIQSPLAGLSGLLLDARKGTLTPLAPVPAGTVSSTFDPSGSAIHYLTQKSIETVGFGDAQTRSVPFDAEAAYDLKGEMAYIFDHVVRFTEVKFYDTNLHGVDWRMYANRYREFLPSIYRWQDFADLLGELVGELNASHTRGQYSHPADFGDETASLAIFWDDSHRGAGLKVARVLPGSPADRPASLLKPGAVLLAVNGVEIAPDMGIDQLLNHQAGKKVRFRVQPAGGGAPAEEVLVPTTIAGVDTLAYEEWVARRKELTRELSNGRIGYIHVPEMNSPSFERASSELFGEYPDAEAVVVDVRFNLGGNLHDQLITMLTGERAGKLITNKGVVVAQIPEGRWGRPSAVLANASSYSDGSVFPHFYKTYKIGPLVGERVPGTGTAVWWERQLEPGLVYGVPEVGFRDLQTGRWLENTEIVPDVLIYNSPEGITQGRDEQLEAAVKVLLERLPN